MKYSAFIIILIASLLSPLKAQARIDIVPQKVVIDSRERSGEFTILNLFNQKGSFRIELLSYKQNENGIYEELKAPLDQRFDPSKIVRFSPRQFSLEPGGRQKVRMSLRKPADLPEGEYRFHIKATRFADEAPEQDSRKAAVTVQMNMGVAIPVIVRHGNVSSKAQISNPKLIAPELNDRNRPELHLDVNREGNGSAIGRLEVFWQPDQSEVQKIGVVSNANVFTEINKRTFAIPLTDMPLGKGQILVRYSDEIEEGKIIDEVVFDR